MAVQAMVGLVIGHGDIALRAADGLAAGTAINKLCVAAAVDKQHHLPARVDAVVHALHQRLGKNALVAQPQLLAHIGQRHLGQRTIVHAMGHFQQRIIAALHACKGQDGWGCTGQHQRRALALAAGNGNLSRVILGKMLALVALLMLLIHHDQPQPLHRRKHRRARADHHPRASQADTPPLVKALTRGQARMQHRGHIAKARAEPRDHLRGQHDLRHQHNGSAPTLQAAAHGADEYFGLAASGDAMQQKGALSAINGGQQLG